jgi:hypothetical protein
MRLATLFDIIKKSLYGEKMKKIACVIYYFGDKYKGIGSCATNSFKKFHPDVDLYHVNDENGHEYNATKHLKEIGYGAYKYLLAAEIMLKNKYDKVIILGADTITCSRLDEFIDNDEDILATLDYPYRLQIPGIGHITPDSETHLNADVVCFNNVEPILEIVKIANKFRNYAEQGALNHVVWSGQYNFSTKIVDGPYQDSKVVYNARAKGNIVDASGTKPWAEYTTKFYVHENKLFTHSNKQLKVWHYCEGLGTLNNDGFSKIINWWREIGFNEETKHFFKEHCGCEDFFDKEFKI